MSEQGLLICMANKAMIKPGISFSVGDVSEMSLIHVRSPGVSELGNSYLADLSPSSCTFLSFQLVSLDIS